jgi:transposase
VTRDGAEWIRGVVAERAPEATVCLDTFHLIGWATNALDVRRQEWNRLQRNGGASAAKEFTSLRWLLLRNWENLSSQQKGTIRDLERANKRALWEWQFKEELRDIFTMPFLAACRALDAWLAYSSRSKLAPFVKLARTIRYYRASNEATLEWKLTNGISESNDPAIGRIRSAARSFHDPERFITMVMLDRAGIAPQLPWAIAS